MALVKSDRKPLTSRGDRARVKASELIGGTDEKADDPNDQYDDPPVLREGEFVPIYSERVPKDTVLAFGYGTDDRNKGRSAFTHCHLEASGNGTGADGDTVTGNLWIRIRDTRNRRTKEETPVGDLSDLSDARDDNRTEKPMFPVMEPAARPDQFVQYGVVADSDSDGVEVSAADSDVRQYLTDIQVR